MPPNEQVLSGEEPYLDTVLKSDQHREVLTFLMTVKGSLKAGNDSDTASLEDID